MNVIEAVRTRRSVRKFRQKDIPDELLSKLIEALVAAPSAGNLQSRKFFFVRDGILRKQLAAVALGQNFIAAAPLAIVCCADSDIGLRYGERGVQLYSIQDVAASVMCMMLAAHELGLGTCWVGAFDEKMVSQLMGLPPRLRPVAIVPVGYPERLPGPTPRVSPEQAVEFR